jgi:hypothetical protein
MFPLAFLVAFAIISISADDAFAKRRHRLHQPSPLNNQTNTSTSVREKAAVSPPQARVDPTAPLMPKMVRTITIKPETWADHWVELRTTEVTPSVFAALVKDPAATTAPAATNNWSGTQQPTYTMRFSGKVNAPATANVTTETLRPSTNDTSFDIWDAAAMIGGALVVLCGVGLRHYVIRIKQRYGAVPIDPSKVPIDLASRRRIIAP